MAVDTIVLGAATSVGTASGVYPIPLIGTTVAGFIGRTERGPVNEAVTIRSYSEFSHVFGGHFDASLMSYAVQDYFLHGGRKAVVVRVCNRATRARLDVPAAGEFLHLQARHPGKQETLRVSVDHERVEDDALRFNLVVQRLRNAGSSLIADQELYPLVSLNATDERFIVDALRDSKLVSLAGPLPATRPDPTPPDRPGDAVKYIDLADPGADGEDLTDYDIIGSNKEGTGLFAFEHGTRIDLLCIPPAAGKDVGMTALVAADRFCSRHRAIMIWDPPWSWQSVDQALIGARQIACTSRNLMTYFPRVRPRGERARFAAGLPACGAIAGMLAYHDKRGVWQANNDYLLKTSLTAMEDLLPRQASMLHRCGVNAFVRSLGSHAALVGNVTVGSASYTSNLWCRLDRRRLYFFILNAIEDAARAAATNLRPSTMQILETQVRNFFSALHERGALTGRTHQQAFFVHAKPKGDEFGAFRLRFGLAMDKPGEFVDAEIDIEPGQAGDLEHSPVIEAEQLFS